MRVRCINIDWLECYCLEVAGVRDADYFKSVGFYVESRDYGTRHMSEVFTLFDRDHNPFIEVRRAPRSKTGKHTIYPDNACNIRLVNRYCYFDNAATLMADFIARYGYEFRRIYRIDIALDFERFDRGDMPSKVLKRIVNGTYRKVYQANRRIQGGDAWEGCQDNYISYGKPESMVLTRFYNKSKELKDTGYKKPWITQAWFEAGLVDDPVRLYKTIQGHNVYFPEIWRLEFQVNSSARGWLRIDGEHKGEWVEHSLDAYAGRDMLLTPFAYLVAHYFQFRVFQKGRDKYRCPEKILFDFGEWDAAYKIMNTVAARAYEHSKVSVINTLKRLRDKTMDAVMRLLYDALIENYQKIQERDFTLYGSSPKMTQLLAILRQEEIISPQTRQMMLDFLEIPYQ